MLSQGQILRDIGKALTVTNLFFFVGQLQNEATNLSAVRTWETAYELQLFAPSFANY